MPTKSRIETQAALYQALEPLLPELIKRGLASYLADLPPTTELGLSAVDTEPVAMEAIVSWAQMPNAELLQESSEPANAEKLRRSFEAFELFNASSDVVLSPTPNSISSLADVDAAYAASWLTAHGHNQRVLEYLGQLGYESVGEAGQANRVAMARAKDGRKTYRDWIKWSEEKYGDYSWA